MSELKRARQVEYGTWVATEDIYHGAALAFRQGQSVPVSNVEQHGYDELQLVRRIEEPAEATPAPRSSRGVPAKVDNIPAEPEAAAK